MVKGVSERKPAEEELHLLLRINNMLSAGVSQEEVFKTIVDGLRSLYNYESVAIHLLSKDKKHLIVRGYSADSKVAKKLEKLTGLIIMGYRIPLSKGTLFKKVVDTGKPVITDDISWVLKSYAGRKSIYGMTKIGAMLTKAKWGIGVPLLAGDKVVGVIGCGSKEKLTDEDSERFANFGAQAGLAIEKQQKYGLLEEMVKERTAELLQQNEFMNIVLGSLTHPFYVIDAKDYTIKLANSAAYEGKLPEDLTCYALTHRRNKPCSSREHACTLEEVKRTKKPAVVEHLHYDKNGNLRTMEVHGYPVFDDSGNIIQMIEYSLDITERRKAEEELIESERRFRETLTKLNMIAVQLDGEGNITFANDFLLKLTGWEHDEIIGKNWMDIFIPEKIREEIKQVHETNLTSGKIFSHYENDIISKDGERRLITWNNSRLLDLDGNIIGITSIGEDITERRKAEEKLKTAYEELKSLDELKSDIIANVSHELRTPITIISTGLDLLKMEEDVESRNELLKMAHNALSRQNRIVEDLITAVSFKKEKIELNPEPIGIDTVITLVYGKLKSMAQENKATLSFKLDEDIHLVNADFKKLEHVLRNLVHNAIKFSKKEGGEVIIEAKEEDGKVEVSVSDKGVGIPEDKLDHIFDPLYQGDSSASRSFEGTGMGLAIAKDLVEAHGGSIWAESTVGEGTSIYFTLPIFGEM